MLLRPLPLLPSVPEDGEGAEPTAERARAHPHPEKRREEKRRAAALPRSSRLPRRGACPARAGGPGCCGAALLLGGASFRSSPAPRRALSALAFAARLAPGARGGRSGRAACGLHSLKVTFLLCQHLQEQLDLDLSPLEYMMKCYPEIKEKEEMRKIIGRYGLTGKQQVSVSC